MENEDVQSSLPKPPWQTFISTLLLVLPHCFSNIGSVAATLAVKESHITTHFWEWQSTPECFRAKGEEKGAGDEGKLCGAESFP